LLSINILNNFNFKDMKSLRLVLLITILSLSIFIANSQVQNKPKVAPKTNKADTVYKRLDVAPKFKGGTGALYKLINESIKYPEEAKTKGIEGKVVVKFIIDSKGKVSNASIFRGVNKLLDDEAVRVINLLPDWVPGQAGGKNVASYVQMPVHFKLK
jgi:TonB family protein